MTEAPASTEDLLLNLDEGQRAVAEELRGPVCVLAGAGTGKTRAPLVVSFLLKFNLVLFHRVDGRISQGRINEESAVVYALV